MANTIIGKVLSVGQTQSFPTKSGSEFQKRELIIDASRFDEYTGERRENFPSFTFLSKNVDKLDGVAVGQLVEVSFIISGRKYEKDGQVRYINDIVGYKVEPFQRGVRQGVRGDSGSVEPSASAVSAPAAAPSPAPNVPQATSDDGLPF